MKQANSPNTFSDIVELCAIGIFTMRQVGHKPPCEQVSRRRRTLQGILVGILGGQQREGSHLAAALRSCAKDLPRIPEFPALDTQGTDEQSVICSPLAAKPYRLASAS
jgi:hypothetical protein